MTVIFLLCIPAVSQFLPYLMLLPREAGKSGLSFDTCELSLICRLCSLGVFLFAIQSVLITSMRSCNDLHSSHALRIFRTLQLLS